MDMPERGTVPMRAYNAIRRHAGYGYYRRRDGHTAAMTVDEFRALPDRDILRWNYIGPALAAPILTVRDTWPDEVLIRHFGLLPTVDIVCNWVGEGVPIC